MAVFDWIQRVESISPAALTVMAQAIDPDDTDALVWNTFFPRQDVDSIRISEVSDIDFRPVADNREWNAPGRHIPLKVPATKELKMVPTEAYFVIDELEMQTLGERAGGNQDKLIEIMGADITARSLQNARACYRRLELNAMQAWANGNAITTDPYGGTTTVSFGFSATRYLTAGTAWNDAGVNAYELFLQFIEDGITKIGATPIGAVMRRATMKVVKADAPNPYSPTSTIEMSVDQLNDKLTGDLGTAFRIVLMEHSGDVFGDAGPHNYSRTDYWPAQHVALVPPGGQIGTTKFAPVLRAGEIDRNAPDAGIDTNGVTAYHHTQNDGKSLKVAGQLNVFSIPAERNVYVTDAGV